MEQINSSASLSATNFKHWFQILQLRTAGNMLAATRAKRTLAHDFFPSDKIPAKSEQNFGTAAPHGDKADNCENDDGVVAREEEPDPKSKWKNRLGRSDEGDADDDDDVLLQTLMQTNGTLMALTRCRVNKIAKRRTTDVDGDGVEADVTKNLHELDGLYVPAAFGVAEEINNAQHKPQTELDT